MAGNSSQQMLPWVEKEKSLQVPPKLISVQAFMIMTSKAALLSMDSPGRATARAEAATARTTTEKADFIADKMRFKA